MDLNSQLDLNRAKLQQLREEQAQTLWGAFAQGLDDAARALGDVRDVMYEVGGDVFQSFESGLATFLGHIMTGTKGARKAFQEFANGVVTELNRIAAKMIAVSIIGQITGLFAPKLGSVGMGELGYAGLTEGQTAGAAFSHGGIAPHIKGFRRLQHGGVTSGPIMALLGDNASGRELVIPAESIHKDHVSGHVREKEDKDITIVNVNTPDLIWAAMSAAQGRKVIVNAMGADFIQRGASYRIIRQAG
jgi:hypothetical protein